MKHDKNTKAEHTAYMTYAPFIKKYFKYTPLCVWLCLCVSYIKQTNQLITIALVFFAYYYSIYSYFDLYPF